MSLRRTNSRNCDSGGHPSSQGGHRTETAKDLCAPLLLTIFLLAGGCAGGGLTERKEDSLATETDALGNNVSIRQYPRRIVSTAPSNTEMLLSLGLRDRLVGVTLFYGHPERVEGVPRVGGYINPDTSKIVSLSPDIVFAARGNSRDAIEQLRQHGIRVFTLDTKTVRGLLSDIGKVGALAGANEKARQITEEIRKDIRAVRNAVGELPSGEKPSVFWIGQEEPLRTAGPGSLVDELIGLAGGENVAGEEQGPWPAYSMEKLVLRDPEVLILSEDKYKNSPEKVSVTISKFKRHPIWGRISAVREGRVYHIPADFLGQPSPRVVTGLRLLARRLHPDSFPGSPAEEEHSK